MGGVEMARRNLPRAAELIRHAMALYHRIGSQFEVANCLNNLAEIDRLRGDLEAAVQGYQRAIALHDAIGAGKGGVFPRFNLGLLYLSSGRYGEARQTLEVCREDLEQTGRLVLLGAVSAWLLPCTAHEGDWRAWDTCFQQVVRYAESGVVEPDDAWALQHGAELARAAGEIPRAREAYRQALTFWQTLNRDDKRAELEAILKDLG